MKSKDQNSRIKFGYKEIEIIKKSLQHWIEIDIQKFAGKGINIPKPILDFITIRTINIKEEYTLNLNCQQLSYIHGAVAEEYLDYKAISKDVAKNICRNIEDIMRNNYKLNTMDICHPCCVW